MNLIWNKNIQLFSQRFPELAKMYKDAIQFVEAHSESPETFVDFWIVSAAKNGELTATENNLRLHSTYNPSREAASSINTDAVNSKSNLIFFGFGLGYHILEASKIKNKKLILIEPEPMHFFSALLFLDWTSVFKIEQLVLAVGCPAESILQLIENSSKINIGNTGVSDSFILDIPAFTNHNQQYFDSVREIIKRNIEKNKINEATLKKFGKLWIKNSLTNINKYEELEPINKYKDICKTIKVDIPFLLIGAGPSLEKIIPYLKELKERCVILCVETALHSLLRAGIQPDFIFLMDPQYWAYKHIAGLSAPDSILITELCTYPSVFRFSCKQILLSSSQFPVGQYFEKKLNYFPGDLGTGGSVASSAWNFAHYCGAKKIYLAGLDLGFPQKQTHIKGSSAEQTFHTVSNRIGTAEKSGISSLFSANAQAAKDYCGKEIITDNRMKMFAWWFESRIANCPDVSTYTFCTESLNIPGVSIADLNTFLQTTPIINTEKNLFLSGSKFTKIDSEKFSMLKKIFPDEDFWEDYGFLKEYF